MLQGREDGLTVSMLALIVKPRIQNCGKSVCGKSTEAQGLGVGWGSGGGAEDRRDTS